MDHVNKHNDEVSHSILKVYKEGSPNLGSSLRGCRLSISYQCVRDPWHNLTPCPTLCRPRDLALCACLHRSKQCHRSRSSFKSSIIYILIFNTSSSMLNNTSLFSTQRGQLNYGSFYLSNFRLSIIVY